MPEVKNFYQEYSIERDSLNGNLNRMYLEDDFKMIEYHFHYAKIRLERMYNICIEKFISSPVPEQGGCEK